VAIQLQVYILSYTLFLNKNNNNVPKTELIAENVETFAGFSEGFVNGKGTESQFNTPHGICFNPNDNCFYVCDHGNHAIRKLRLNGILRKLRFNGIFIQYHS
jgi:hypothetical protein